jgi:TRAP-type C4-dicarboxylate transport system permease small subunit
MWLKKVLRAEGELIRVETWLLVGSVLVMLLLASYNVLYRNLLVPWQRSLASSGPPITTPATTPPPPSNAPDAPKGDDQGFGGGFGQAEAPAAGDDSGGFGGGFGQEEPPQEAPPKEAPPTPAAGDDSGGFGGGFGQAEAPQPPAEGDSGGFGGGFGADPTPAPADAEGFGGGFGDAAEAPALTPTPAPTITSPAPPQGGPPPEGSTAAQLVALIDAIKIEWIDILLRQMVILVGFLGAMLATQRKKHINIDAASKLLPQSARRVSALLVNAVTVLVCVVLAVAGAEMVQFSLAFPKELLPWADEWSFQLLFPVGFGLLAVHFVVRVLEDIERLRTGAPMPLEGEAAQAAAMHKEGQT